MPIKAEESIFMIPQLKGSPAENVPAVLFVAGMQGYFLHLRNRSLQNRQKGKHTVNRDWTSGDSTGGAYG